MPILDRYLYRELLLNIVLTFVVIASVFLVGGAVSLLYKAPELDLIIFLQAAQFQLLEGLTFVLPISMLTATVFVFGRMASENEITTLRAAGVHPNRLLFPPLVIAGVLSLLATWIGTEHAPRGIFLVRSFMKHGDTLQRVLKRTVENGRTHVALGNHFISWGDIEYDPSVRFLDVTIQAESGAFSGGESKSDQYTVVRAASAEPSFDGADTVMLNLQGVELLDGPAFQGAGSDEVIVALQLGASRGRYRLKYNTGPEMYAIRQRAADGLSPVTTPEAVDGAIHSRFALAASPLVFVLMGAPLAMVFRSGNRMVAFLLSFLIGLFVYYPSLLIAKTLGDEQIVDPVFAAWSGNLLMLALGLGLLTFVVRR